MTDVKRLLDEATPLPWTLDAHEWEDGTTYSVIGPVTNGVSPVPVAGREADAALIVYAVNRLPDYEAAVDALVAVSRKEYDDGPCWCEVGPNGNFPNHLDLCQQARAALARLRGKMA